MAGTTFSAANWSGYDEQSVTNPGSALTDFTLLINVANLSSDWKSNVQSDGADIRLTKGDGTTELPYDLIDWAYNAGSPTGWIRVKWSGTLASSGTQNVRVWAGYTGGTAMAYDATETFGSDNAYDSNFLGYWPNGGGTDRTSNGNDLAVGSAGNPTIGGATGKIGAATDYDGSNDYCSSTPSLPTQWTMMAWAEADSLSTGGAAHDCICGFTELPGSPTRDRSLGYLNITGTPTVYAYQFDGAAKNATITLANSTGFKHVAGKYNGSNLIAYANGSPGSGVAASNPFTGYSSPEFVSGQGDTVFFNGRINELQLHSVGRTDDWIAQEYSQSNDNATFWSTWAWTAVGGGDSVSRTGLTLLGCG